MQRDMGLFRRARIRLDPEMELQHTNPEPATAADCLFGELGNFSQSEQRAEKCARRSFSADRYRGLEMVDRQHVSIDCHVRRVLGLHADHIIARVDMVDFPGNATGQIAKQVNAGTADVVDCHVTAQWRIILVPF